MKCKNLILQLEEANQIISLTTQEVQTPGLFHGKWGQMGIYESDVTGTPYDGVDYNNDGYWDAITKVAYLKLSNN
jgi:hypothetical protein